MRALQQALATSLPGSEALIDGGAPLEIESRSSEPPRVTSARVIEGAALRAIRVEGDPDVHFAAFLDGTQRSQVLRYVSGFPVICGTVAAAIRERRDRRLVNWRRGPIVSRRVYAPKSVMSADEWMRLEMTGIDVADSSEPDAATGESPAHPFAVVERARELVQNHREAAESALAGEWCASEQEMLFMDGGIRGDDRVARSACVAGVIKSHRTLYADGDALRIVLSLGEGWRSSVFSVETGRRAPVLSWYLRLRSPKGRDPMWGLVRVEVSADSEPASRANAVSRWILAESSPLSAPDARWDKMAYGVRDVEQFLRALV